MRACAIGLLVASVGGCSFITDFATHDGGGGAGGQPDARGKDGSGGTGGNGGNGGAGGSRDAAIDRPLVDAAVCPDVLGAYSIVMVSGAGCGDLNPSAPQCILATNETCFVHFNSTEPGGGTGAINGGAMLRSDGSFSGASLILGTIQRTGCTGSWISATSTMTVNCGGSGSSQSCTVTMVRTGATCP